MIHLYNNYHVGFFFFFEKKNTAKCANESNENAKKDTLFCDESLMSPPREPNDTLTRA